MKPTLYVLTAVAVISVILIGLIVALPLLRNASSDGAYVAGTPEELQGTWLDNAKNGFYFEGNGTAIRFWEGDNSKYDELKDKWMVNGTFQVSHCKNSVLLKDDKEEWRYVFVVEGDRLRLEDRARFSTRELNRIGPPGHSPKFYTQDDVVRARDSFLASLDAQSLYEMARQSSVERAHAPYIRGKLIGIDVSEGEWRLQSFEHLAEQLSSYRVSEIGTILFYKREYRSVGRYLNGGAAMLQIVHLHLVDRRAKRLIVSEVLQGSPPPTTSQSLGGEVGSDPLVEFMTRLRTFKQIEMVSPD